MAFAQGVTFGADPERFTVVCHTLADAKFFDEMVDLIDDECGVLSGHCISLWGWSQRDVEFGESTDAEAMVREAKSSLTDELEEASRRGCTW